MSLRYCNGCITDKPETLFTKRGHECSDCKKLRREKEREKYYKNRVRCDCGCYISDGNPKEKHEQTKSHQNYLKWGYKNPDGIHYLSLTEQYDKLDKCLRKVRHSNYIKSIKQTETL